MVRPSQILISPGLVTQREGMGLLEYQAEPSLSDVAQDGAPEWGKWCGSSGQAAWTVHHEQNQTPLGNSPPASQTPCWASPLASVRIGVNLFKPCGQAGGPS
jgi:hypothetical protein